MKKLTLIAAALLIAVLLAAGGERLLDTYADGTAVEKKETALVALFPGANTSLVDCTYQDGILTPSSIDPQIHISGTNHQEISNVTVRFSSPLETDCIIQLFYDSGKGYSEQESIVVMAKAGDRSATLPLAQGRYYSVRVDINGTVWVTCPAEYTDGYIYFIVNDGKGGSQIRVVTFYERKMTLPEGLVFPVDAAGATVTVPYSVNFAFEPVFADGCDSWIHLLSTRAETVEGNLSFQVDANTAEEERFGFIEIHPVNHPEYVHTRIAVRQAAATAPEQGE